MKFGRAPTTKQTCGALSGIAGAYRVDRARLAGVLALKALFSTPRGSVLIERASVDRLGTWGLVALFGAMAAWNAFPSPPIGGFDASEHIAYARGLADRGE